MKRWLFNIAAPASLALLAATVALWVRSYSIADSLFWRRGHPSGADWVMVDRCCRTSRGHFEAWQSEMRWPASEFQLPVATAHSMLRADNGFRFDHKPVDAYPSDYDAWRLPLAVPAMVAAWPIVYWIVLPSIRSRMRLRRGLCPWCGYDLRAGPGRCPECGNEAAAAPRRVT
jgi:hypothetical protein